MLSFQAMSSAMISTMLGRVVAALAEQISDRTRMGNRVRSFDMVTSNEAGMGGFAKWRDDGVRGGCEKRDVALAGLR